MTTRCVPWRAPSVGLVAMAVVFFAAPSFAHYEEERPHRFISGGLVPKDAEALIVEGLDVHLKLDAGGKTYRARWVYRVRPTKRSTTVGVDIVYNELPKRAAAIARVFRRRAIRVDVGRRRYPCRAAKKGDAAICWSRLRLVPNKPTTITLSYRDDLYTPRPDEYAIDTNTVANWFVGMRYRPRQFSPRWLKLAITPKHTWKQKRIPLRVVVDEGPYEGLVTRLRKPRPKPRWRPAPGKRPRVRVFFKGSREGNELEPFPKTSFSAQVDPSKARLTYAIDARPVLRQRELSSWNRTRRLSLSAKARSPGASRVLDGRVSTTWRPRSFDEWLTLRYRRAFRPTYRADLKYMHQVTRKNFDATCRVVGVVLAMGGSTKERFSDDATYELSPCDGAMRFRTTLKGARSRPGVATTIYLPKDKERTYAFPESSNEAYAELPDCGGTVPAWRWAKRRPHQQRWSHVDKKRKLGEVWTWTRKKPRKPCFKLRQVAGKRRALSEVAPLMSCLVHGV